MPASSLFDQLREQSRPSFEPEPLDTATITKNVDTRLAKEAVDYQKGQDQAAKDAAKQQVQSLKDKGYTVTRDETGAAKPLTAPNGEPVRRKLGSRIHVGEQTGDYYEPDLQKGGLKPAVGHKKTDKNGRIVEDFGGGLTKDHGEDPAWAKQKEDKTLLTKAEASIRDKMIAPPPDGMDVVKVKKDYGSAQKKLIEANKNLEIDKTSPDYISARDAAQAEVDKLKPQNDKINEWSRAKQGLKGNLAQINTHRKLLGEGAFTDEHRKQWQSVIAPPAAPAPATVTPPAPTAGESGRAGFEESKKPMSESPTAAPAPVAVQPTNAPPVAPPVPAVTATQPNAVATPITPAPREQLVTPEAVADLPIDAHHAALQTSGAALQQNAEAIKQREASIAAPVTAVDAKIANWQVKSQAALATGDAAISMMQPDGQMSPLFAASTKKEIEDLYNERVEAQRKVAPQLEEIDGAWAAHQEDVDAHNRAVELLNGKVVAAKEARAAEKLGALKELRSDADTAPFADKLDELHRDTENTAKLIQETYGDNPAAKEAALNKLREQHEAKGNELLKGADRASDKEYNRAVEVNGTPVARYNTFKEGETTKAKLQFDKGEPVVIDLPKFTEDDVQSKIKENEATAAKYRENAKRYRDSADSPFGANNYADLVTQALDSEKKAAELDAKNEVLSERGKKELYADHIREELKKDQYADKFPDGNLFGDFKRGVASAVITTGIAARRLFGQDSDNPNMATLLEANEKLGQAVPGSAQRQLRGGLWNNAVSSGVESMGQMLPTVFATGGLTKLATGALGKTGLSTVMGELAPTLSMAPTSFGSKFAQYDQQANQLEEQAKNEKDPEKAAKLADDAKKIRSSRDIAGISQAIIDTLTEQMSGGHAPFVDKGAFKNALRNVPKEILGEANEEMVGQLAQNILEPFISKGVNNPQILDDVLESGLAGALAAGPMVGLGAIKEAFHKGNEGTGAAAVDPEPALPPDIKMVASEAELNANPNGGDAEKASVLRDIATGAKVSTMTEGELNAVGLTHKNNDVVPIGGKDAPEPAVQIDGKGNAIILQPALDELKATFPATAELVGMDEKAAREYFAQNGNADTRPTEPVVENAAETTPAVAAEPRVGPTPSGEGAAKPAVGAAKASPAAAPPAPPSPPAPKTTPKPAPSKQKRETSKWGKKIGDEWDAGLPDKVISVNDKSSVGVHEEYKVAEISAVHSDGSIDVTKRDMTAEEVAAKQEKMRKENKTRAELGLPENEIPEAAAKHIPTVANPAALQRAADIVAKAGDTELAQKIREKVANTPLTTELHPKVIKVVNGIVDSYARKGIKIGEGTTDGASGIELDVRTGKIVLDLAKIHANTEGSNPNDTIAWVRDSVARHELVHLISTTDKKVSDHLDELWSQLSDEDKSASAKAYYKDSRDKWDDDFRGKHEFLVQLVQAAEDGKLEPALLKLIKNKTPELFATMRKLVDALIARLERILTDGSHKAHGAAKKVLEAFKEARAKLLVEPAGKVDATSGLTDAGEVEGDVTKGLKRVKPAEVKGTTSGIVDKGTTEGDVTMGLKRATVDQKAHEAAASPHNDLTPPTPAQIEADNYKVGKVENFAGSDISIETPAGAKRREEWPALKDHYGRILGTKGADGELLDIFIKEGTPLDWNGPIFVINQNKPDGTFDETKAIAGAASVAEAREIYKRNYSKGWKGLGGIVKFDSLKQWVESDHSGKAVKKGKTEPVAARVSVSPATDELLGKNNRGEPVYWSDNAKTHYSISNGRVQTGPWVEGLPDSAIDRLHELVERNKGVDVKPVNVKTGGMENQQQEQGLSPEAKAERIQMIRDMMKTNKENGKPIPQGWINKLAELEGSSKPQEGEIYSNIVAGHPQFDSGNSELQYLVPIKVSKIEDLDSKFDRAQSLLDKWNKEIGTLEYKAKNGKTPALRKKAAADLSKLGATKDARDLLRDETIPELERLRRELLSRSPTIITPPAPPQPKAEVVQPPAPPKPESTPALIAEVKEALTPSTPKDTLFELPPRARSLSGMRDAVRRKLDVLERQQEDGNFPADKSRGVRADDWKIVERDGKFIIQEKVTGEEDLGFPTYDTRAEAEAKVKAENDANTLDNRTTVDGEDKLRERIDKLRTLLAKIEAKMPGIKDTSEAQREEQRRVLSAKPTPKPMNMAGESRSDVSTLPPRPDNATGYTKRFYDAVDAAKKDGATPYVVIRRSQSEGKMQWEAYTPEGKLLTASKTISGQGSIAQKLNGRVDRYASAAGFDLMAEATTKVTPEWIVAQIKQADNNAAKDVAEANARLKRHTDADAEAAAKDPNIGREFNSPHGKQKIVAINGVLGGMPQYEVQTVGTDSIRNISVKSIEDWIKRQEHELTPEYEQEKKDAAEKAKERAERDARQAAEKAEKDGILGKYFDAQNLTPMQRGKLAKVFEAQVAKQSGTKIYRGDRASVVREMLESGYTPKTAQVKAIQDLTGQRMNRMDNREQADFERKQKAAGMKTEYMLAKEDGSGFVVTKAEHDYAQWLTTQKSATSVVKAAEPTYLDKVLDAAIKDDLGELTIDVPEKNRSLESLERAVALIEARGLNASTDGQRILVRGFKELRAKAAEKPTVAPEKAPELMTPSEWQEAQQRAKVQDIHDDTTRALKTALNEAYDAHRAADKARDALGPIQGVTKFNKEAIVTTNAKRRAAIKAAEDAALAYRRADRKLMSAQTLEGFVTRALAAHKPVSAPAVDAYKLTLPEGYVRDGDVYRYEPANPTQSPTPAEGQSTGGVVEGEKAPTAQEWKALHEEHQALLAASKDNPQAWKPQEWQAHRSALMKREANSRKVPAVWSHNELITATGKYELDHETGELTKLQPLSEIGFLHNVDSLFKDSIPESGIDGGNDLARKLWAKVKAERAEGEQRKADAAAKAQAESKVKAEEQAKLADEQKAKFAEYEASIPKVKFEPATLEVELMGGPTKLNGYRSGDWFIELRRATNSPRVWYVPAKQKLPDSLALRNQTEAKDLVTKVVNANKGFSGDFSKDEPQRLRILDTLKAWKDNVAPAWFTTTPATPKETSPILEALNTVATPYGWSVRGNELWNSKNKVGTIELKKGRIRILDNAGTLRGTLGNADGLGAYLEKTYYATKKAVETTTPATPKETDKPPASSDVVKPAKQGFFDEPAPVVPTAPGVSASDIPLDIAERAHNGTSFVPDRRARGEQRGYVNHMNAVWEDLNKRVTTDGERELAATAFENYRQKWIEQYKGLLSSRSGLISTMIAGGSKFPVERQRKKSDAYGNRLNEFLEWDKKAQSRMLQTVRPTEARSISSDRSDAVEVLQKKIDDAKAFQERMKAANSIVKSKKLTDDVKVARLMSEVKLSESNARALLKPDFAGRIGFAQYELTNNNANIKRMEGRVSQITAEKARPTGSATFEGGRVEENDANNRIQVFFDAKPDVAMRDKLKANGFHWSPNEGAWQRQRNANSRYATEQLLGVKLTAETAPVEEVTTQEFKPEDEPTDDVKSIRRTSLRGSDDVHPASPSARLQTPSPDDAPALSYDAVVSYLTEHNIPVTVTREEYEAALGEELDKLPAGPRREITSATREQEMWAPYLSGEPRSFRDILWPEALEALQKDPFKGTKLVDSILAKPRVLSDTDRAVLTHEFLRRRQDYNAATNAIMSATPENKLEAEQDLARARDAYFAVTEAADRSGSEAGRALNAIKLALKEDYSPARIEARFRAAKGSALNEAELKHAAELAQAHKERDDALEEVRTKQDQLKALEAIIHSYEHGATAKPDLSRIKKAAKAGSEWIKVKMAAMFSRTTLEAPSPADEASEQLAAVGAALIEDGANTLEAFSKAFEELHPGALAAFNKDAAVIFEASKSKLAEEKAAALKDTTPQGITNKIKGKREEIADLKASDLNNLALAIVQHEGVRDVETLRSKMHERLEEIFPHITERDVAKAWTGFEKAIYPSNDPFRKIVSDLRSQEQLILKAQVLIEEERLAAKSGRQFPPRTDAQRKLIREYNDLVKASGLTTSDPATQLASTQSRIIKALQNRKSDLEAQVKAKKREVRTSSTAAETPEMKRLRDEIAALNAKLDLLDPRNTGPTDAQKVKLAENGLKKSLENVDKEIAELERKVKNKDLSEPTPGNTKTVPWSTVIAERRRDLSTKRTLRDDLANQLDDLREAAKPVADPLMNVLSKWEQRQNLATVKAAPRTKSRLEELAKRYLSAEEPNHRFIEDAMGLGLSQGDAQDAQLILDAERNRRESVALAALKRRTQRSIEHNAAKAQAFDEDSPLVKKTPAAKKLDKEADDLYLKRKLAEREVKRAEEKFRLRNRDPLRKAADFVVKWRRGFILADYVVLYKLGMAAAWRTVFTPIEEGIGAGISAAMPGLSKNAPREYGASVRAEAEAITEGFRYLVNNFGKVLKHGISSIDAKYSDKPDFNDLDPSYSDYIGNMHAAIKLLPKANEFYRSFRKRTEAAIRNGQDATSPGAVQAIGAAAYLDAQRAIFMNPNFVSEAWRSAITKLRKTETSSNWAKVTADILEAALPIVKVPTNILFETLGSYVGGILRETPFAVKSAAKAATNFDGQGFAKRFQDEYAKLPPEQAEAVLRHLKKGAFGNALMLLVMLTGVAATKLIGGLWTPDDKREHWQVKSERFRLSEDSKDLPRWIAHNPVFDTLHFASTAYHYATKAAHASQAIAAKAELEVEKAERRMEKAHADSKSLAKATVERDLAKKKLEAARAGGDAGKIAWTLAWLSGLTTSSVAMLEKAPLIGNVGQFIEAMPETKKAEYLRGELGASVIPTGVTNIAKARDEGPDGDPIKRKMESFSDHLKNRIPGLRQTLPYKDGPTDEFGFKRTEAHEPIPAEKAIENFNKQNPDIKYHIPKISSTTLNELPDADSRDAFQIRVGELMKKFSTEGVIKHKTVKKDKDTYEDQATTEIPRIAPDEADTPSFNTIEKLKSIQGKAFSVAKEEAKRPAWSKQYMDKFRSSATK